MERFRRAAFKRAARHRAPMRTSTIAIASMLALTGLAALAAPASAAGDCQESATVNGGLVILTVQHGGGCADVDLYTCTLSRPDPDHPSTPVWECRKRI